MTSWYATSTDGLTWTWRGPALDPTPGTWDARGRHWPFCCRGRAHPAGKTARYLSVMQLPDGVRLYWDASCADAANELRTEYVPRPLSPSHS